MSTIDLDADEQPARHAADAAPPEPPQPAGGDPALIGLPAFIVGSVALGLTLVGYVPATAVGAPLPIILAATGLGLAIAAVWAAALGQSAVASVFAIFAGFWWSYATLVLGLTHGWFGIGEQAAVATQELFLICWLVVIVMLTLATLRLPAAFTALFTLIDLALLLVLLATAQGSAGMTQAGGIVVLTFAALGVYLYVNSASLATGGSALPLGRPVLR